MHEGVRKLPALNGCEPADDGDGALGSEIPRILQGLELEFWLESGARALSSQSDSLNRIALSPPLPPPRHTAAELPEPNLPSA